jgi:hypothetical protein
VAIPGVQEVDCSFGAKNSAHGRPLSEELKYIQQETFFFVAWSFYPFYVDLRPDFCGSRRFFPKKGQAGRAKPLNNVIKSIFTAKVTTKTVAAANSADEIAAGADGQS